MYYISDTFKKEDYFERRRLFLDGPSKKSQIEFIRYLGDLI